MGACSTILFLLGLIVAFLNSVQSELPSVERIDSHATISQSWMLSDYLNRIIGYFEAKTIYLYYDQNLQSKLVDRIAEYTMEHYGVPVELLRYDPTENITQVNDNYVKTFHINVLHDIPSDGDINLSYVGRKSGDKYNSHFVVVSETPVDSSAVDPDSWLTPIADKFWAKNVFNVLIVFWDAAAQPRLRVFTFNPFGNERYLVELSAHATHRAQLFWDKATNLNRNRLRVSLFHENTRAIYNADGSLSGTDGYLTELMAHKMNATLELSAPKDGFDIGEFLANGSSTGSLAQVLSGAVHISFNTRFLRLKQFYGKAQITFTNGRDDICFMVAKAGYASNIYNIFRAFSSPVWIMVLVSLIVAPIAFLLIYNRQREPQPFENVFFQFYSWFLAQPILRLPDHWATKIYIAFWIIYALLITSSYEGNLTSNLVLRPVLADINTIKQLDNSKLQILTFGRYVDLLERFLNTTPAYKDMQLRIRSVSTSGQMLQHIRDHEMQYAYANKQHINKYLTAQKENWAYGRPMFHNVPECPVPYLVAYALGIGSPYLARINVILRRAQENGLIGYWDRQAEETSSVSTGRVHGSGPVALTLDHMQSAFYILGFGLVISLILLTTESCYWKQRGKRITRVCCITL